jgi:hypothetical protein
MIHPSRHRRKAEKRSAFRHLTSRESKTFFFEKKNQNTSRPLRAGLSRLRLSPTRSRPKVFARFFQKALLSFCSF